MKRLAIYCGSATPSDPQYIETARAVGRGLAERGIGVVYGGGRLGLMDAVADAALAADRRPDAVAGTALIGGMPSEEGEEYAAFFELVDGVMPFPGWEPFEGPDSADLDEAATRLSNLRTAAAAGLEGGRG